MDDEDGPAPTRLQRRSAALAERLPGVERSHQAQGDWDFWKVGGKTFLAHTALPGEPVVTVKVDPADGEGLRAQYPQITPGYHMNKQHWVSVHPGEQVPTEVLDELVVESYRLVVGGLRRDLRPVDPATFRPE
ncbi:MmcQ/YjbR family DNA-binding protein [Microbacterium sp. NPDC058345]|uniref:MmcQ/YjbR family DNA-binding protein n=1 Tax=Microbacterium sp. NPDC058345 TaxID=3346455 RepID=UPI003648F11F